MSLISVKKLNISQHSTTHQERIHSTGSLWAGALQICSSQKSDKHFKQHFKDIHGIILAILSVLAIYVILCCFYVTTL